jgi:hypothetical protein
MVAQLQESAAWDLDADRPTLTYDQSVNQVLKLHVPYHYTKMVRLCLGSVAIRPDQKTSIWSFLVQCA